MSLILSTTKLLADFFNGVYPKYENSIVSPSDTSIQRYPFLSEIGKNGVDCYSKNGHAVTVLTRQS